MAHIIDKKEVLKIARLSQVIVYDDEVSIFLKQLDAVLTYAARVSEVGEYVSKSDFNVDMDKNVVRKDEIFQEHPGIVLAQVPAREGSLIIVPKILEGA